MNNLHLGKAETWLTELGIRTKACATCLMVSRTDMVNFVGGNGEEVAHNEILRGLKDAVSTKLHWGYKDDDWLHLESF